MITSPGRQLWRMAGTASRLPRARISTSTTSWFVSVWPMQKTSLPPDSRISCLSFSCDFAERNLSISERHYRDAGSFVERLSGYILCVWSQRELLALICSSERKTVSKKKSKNWQTLRKVRRDAKGDYPHFLKWFSLRAFFPSSRIRQKQ